MNMLYERLHTPEPAITPPEDFCITAECGHEVYEGEFLYEWQGDTLCPDCMQDKIDNMELYELAALLGCECTVVKRRGRDAGF